MAQGPAGAVSAADLRVRQRGADPEGVLPRLHDETQQIYGGQRSAHHRRGVSEHSSSALQRVHRRTLQADDKSYSFITFSKKSVDK